MANKRNSIHQISCKPPVPDSFLWIFYYQNCTKYEKDNMPLEKIAEYTNLPVQIIKAL